MFGIKTLKQLNNNLVASNTQLVTQIKRLQSSNIAASVNQIRTMIFPSWATVKDIDAYIIFADVYTVVSKIASMCAEIPLVAFNLNNNEDLPPSDKLQQFLKGMTFQEKEQMYLWLLLAGNVYLYKDRVATLGPNKDKVKLECLHPAFMTLIQEDVFPNHIIRYRYQDTRAVFFLEANEVIYEKYFNPSARYDERYTGLSPIRVLAQNLTRLQASMDTTVGQLQNGGTPVIVYDKTPGLDSDRGSGGSAENNEVTVMGQHKDNFARFIRNPENKGAPYFAAGEMGAVQLGLSSVEMEVLAMADVDFGKICNVYSVSSDLFAKKDRPTFNNMGEARKDAYSSAILPNAVRLGHALAKGLADVFGEGKGVKPDTSKIPELQENAKEKAEAFAAMPAVVINEMRTAFGQDELNDPMASRLLVKTGYMLADDLNIEVEPIDNTANDYGK